MHLLFFKTLFKPDLHSKQVVASSHAEQKLSQILQVKLALGKYPFLHSQIFLEFICIFMSIQVEQSVSSPPKQTLHEAWQGTQSPSR